MDQIQKHISVQTESPKSYSVVHRKSVNARTRKKGTGWLDVHIKKRIIKQGRLLKKKREKKEARAGKDPGKVPSGEWRWLVVVLG